MRILSIDDSRAVHAYLTECFRPTGFILEHAYDAKEGLDILSSDKNFNLILLDWEMPGLTGPQIFEKIKKMGMEIPVVMLTSKNSSKDIELMLNEGVSEYVMKPFTIDILYDKIESVTGVTIPRDAT